MSDSLGSETETELSVPDEEDDMYKIGLYIGERNAADERHGRGWAILPNGDQYDGQYRQGRRHGIGLYVFKGGARYYGKYRCGHRSGRGIFVYPDGSMYEGNWRKSIKHGKGRYNYANGDSYTGDWYRGVRHGVGIYTFHTEDSCNPIRFKGTFRQGVRVGPFEIYFGNEDKCMVLHGAWDNLYPQGPAVFSFDQRYMLMGFFKTLRADDDQLAVAKKKFGGGAEFIEEEGLLEEGAGGAGIADYLQMQPSLWYAQDIGCYDYSQLPQEPVPLPLSDSDISVCSLSTVPTEISMPKTISYADEGEEEGEGLEECVPCECECSMSDIETEQSEVCVDPKRDPCAIEIVDQGKC